ncbi:MAE_28990/MAE_18760 family HEPN-like nuclease [Lysobacter sp. FW306-1B-D06B]|uniref:MAE_28990/MAE_18760 family HEPN-like nuclease n=1 Tax=Lysobacter sp. FW306-1B-D06B TaxID=3140250 RepID=UPI0031407FB7
MKSSLSDLISGIRQLDAFLSNTERQAELIALLNARPEQLPHSEAQLVGEVVASATSSRQYVYMVAIVALYGLLERYAISAINDYVMEVSRISGTYERLPERIRANHLQASLRLTEGILKDRFRTDTTWEQVISNLNSCLPGSGAFKLNSSAYSFHRGNITLARLGEMLGGIGVALHPRRVVNTLSYSAYLEQLFPERDISGLSDHELGPLIDSLDDLVERRNSVSHGVLQVDSIESVDLLRERCKFLTAFGQSLYEIMTDELLRYEVERGAAVRLGRPIAVFSSGAMGIRLTGSISIGDRVFALGKGGFDAPAFGKILSLQIQGNPLEHVDADTPIDVGVMTDFKPFRGRVYYRSSSEVW